MPEDNAFFSDDDFTQEPAGATSNPWGGDDGWGDDAPAGDADRGDDFVADDTDEQGVVADEPIDEQHDDEQQGDEQHDNEQQGDADADDVGADDDDADADDDGEQEGDDAGDRKPQNTMVPRDRLNKEVAKRRKLEAELEALRKAPAPEPKADPEPPKPVASKEDFKAMSDALMDGDTETAMGMFNKILTEQRTADAQEFRKAAREEAAQEYAQTQAANELRQAATEVVAAYPELDSNGAESDTGLIEEALELRNTFIQRGSSPAKALRRAVKIIAQENGLRDRTAAAPAKPKPARRPTPDKAKLAERERGRLGGTGAPNKTKLANVEDLTDEQWANLTAEARARMRGDALE